jgi:Coenzyme PQQ synthesis protein D (PqqD)
MTNIPKARNNQIVTQQSENEILIYDLTNNKAHCLNETSTIIWQNCDGNKTVAEISNENKIPEEYVLVALKKFDKANLLQTTTDGAWQNNGLSRRKLLLRAGTTAVALPLLTTLVAPLAVNAQSCLANGQSFDATGGPYGNAPAPPLADLCVIALISQATTVCCSGMINFFSFSTNIQCNGTCGSA